MCGGGGSGGYGGRYEGSSAAELARQAEISAERQKYEENVNSYLKDELKNYNTRDSEAINRHLETVQGVIEGEFSVVKLMFGGSISRYTYVNGISDVDVLVVLKSSVTEEMTPKEVIERFAQQLRDRLPSTTIKTGAMAVTVTFSDGHEIQLLPAIETKTGVRISDPQTGQWSNVVRPEKFAQKLTDVNQNCSGRVIPVIKIVKAINSRLPEGDQLRGYHLESMAIKAFENYSGKLNHRDMVMHFYDQCRTLIRSPIYDSTHQSLHVDDYLGAFQSTDRMKRKAVIERIYEKMRKSESQKSVQAWKELVEDGNLS
jgi:predicted nucleotidyltransferase